MIIDNEYRWWLAAAALILQLLGATLPMCQSFVSISHHHHHHHHHHHTLKHQQLMLMATTNDNEDNYSLDMTSLSKRIKQQQSQYVNLIQEQSKYTENERVPASIHIILFNPNTPQQHDHTVEFPKGSGTNLILAFESGNDCVGFAGMLQDLEFVDPSVSTSRYTYDHSSVLNVAHLISLSLIYY